MLICNTTEARNVKIHKIQRVSLKFKKHFLKYAIHLVLALALAFNAVVLALVWPWQYCCSLGLVPCGFVNIPAATNTTTMTTTLLHC